MYVKISKPGPKPNCKPDYAALQYTKLTNIPDGTDPNRNEPHLPIKLSCRGKCSQELNDDYLSNSF